MRYTQGQKKNYDIKCVLSQVWSEAEERVEHQGYNTTYDNQIAAFLYVK